MATEYRIGKDTIQRYAKDPDRKDRLEAAQEKGLLTEQEERVLANEIELSARRALPLTIPKIERQENAILRMKQKANYKLCGKNWVDRFLD